MLLRGVPRPFPKRVAQKVEFSMIFEGPGTLKIELSSRRELNFHFFTCLQFWSQNGFQNGSKMEPKWLPNPLGGHLGGFLELPQKLSKKCFEKCRFWGSFGDPLGRLLGDIFESFSGHFGDLVLGGVLGVFWEGFGVDFGRILGSILVGFWHYFGLIFSHVLHVFA